MSTPTLTRNEAAMTGAHDSHSTTGTDVDAAAGTVTVYFDRDLRPTHKRLVESDALPVRTVPNGRDPLGRAGEEFGASVPIETLLRWEQARETYLAVLREQRVCLEDIQQREQAVMDADRQARHDTEAQAEAERQAALDVEFGPARWVTHITWNEGRRGRTGIKAISVHMDGCARTARWGDWQRKPVRLNDVVHKVALYGPSSTWTSKSRQPKFCKTCTHPLEVERIHDAVAFGRQAGLDSTVVAHALANGLTEQFDAARTLLALQGTETTFVPSNVPLR